MRKKVKEPEVAVGKDSKNIEPKRSSSCPRCGGQMVAGTHQVSASFPSPALERLVCSDPSCNYVRYTKLDSFAAKTNPNSSSTRGARSA